MAEGMQPASSCVRASVACESRTVTSTALVISGGGRFADPWHPFPETSAQLAAAIHERGWTVEVTDDVEAALTALSADPLPSLLVVNIGWYGPESFVEPATAGLVSALERGLPTLLVHSTLTSFPVWLPWHGIVGGGWTHGVTYHPDYGPGVAIADPDHPITAGLEQPLAIADERYTRLWVDESSQVFLSHDEAGELHPLAWTRTWGASRIVADALGHTADSYRAAGRAALLQRELDWLCQPRP
jgi:type 1 glutamine amidotransferase